jgi:phosphoglycerate dehydrogenase-like enzyme
MKNNTILVLGEPDVSQTVMLETLRSEAAVFVGDSADAFGQAVVEADILFNWSGSPALFREVFLKCPRLRWVHSRSAGLDKSLFPELTESSAVLTNGSGVFSASLGEFALAAILYFAKDLRRMIRNQMAGVWEPFDVLPVEGCTVGIVGYGDIGRAVAARVRAMGMKVLAVKRHVSPEGQSDRVVDEVFGPGHLIEVLARCDYVVVAAPLTAETIGMIGEAEFAAMKPTAVVINLGRGPVINERALVKALVEGRIKGAALDVFDEEPLSRGHPFYKTQNVLLSPHCADHIPEWLNDAMRFFIAQYGRFRKGEPLLNVVDKKLGY